MGRCIEGAGKSMGDADTERCLTPKVLVLAILCVYLCSFWVNQAEVVVLTCQITESVPALPGVAVLIVLVLVNPWLRKFRSGLGLRHAELLAIYTFVVIAISMF